jgi:hypothetical protein
MKQCAFCLKSDHPFHDEEVFAKWIGRRFSEMQWTGIDLQTGKIRTTSKSRQIVGLICKDKICQPCNNNWMSVIENNVKPILGSLMDATRNTPLAARDQRRLAKWLVKTACVLELALRDDAFIHFSSDDRNQLSKGLMPDSISMYIAQYAGSLRDIVALQGNMEPDPNKLPDEFKYLATTHGYVSTLVIKHVALQIFSVRGTNNLPKKLNFIVAPFWSNVAVKIWPLGGKPIPWPPPAILGDASLQGFNERWFGATPTLT